VFLPVLWRNMLLQSLGGGTRMRGVITQKETTQKQLHFSLFIPFIYWSILLIPCYE